jgi:hypothetical protein
MLINIPIKLVVDKSFELCFNSSHSLKFHNLQFLTQLLERLFLMSTQNSAFNTSNLFMLGDTIVIELINLHHQLEVYRGKGLKLIRAMFDHLYNEFNFKNTNFTQYMIDILAHYDDADGENSELEIVGFQVIFGSDYIFICFDN